MKSHAVVARQLTSHPYNAETERRGRVSLAQACFTRMSQKLFIILAFALPNQICHGLIGHLG